MRSCMPRVWSGPQSEQASVRGTVWAGISTRVRIRLIRVWGAWLYGGQIKLIRAIRMLRVTKIKQFMERIRDKLHLNPGVA
eukprot:2513422-Rhodomonas_salina.1